MDEVIIGRVKLRNDDLDDLFSSPNSSLFLYLNKDNVDGTCSGRGGILEARWKVMQEPTWRLSVDGRILLKWIPSM
jgi:hypothetical protein